MNIFSAIILIVFCPLLVSGTCEYNKNKFKGEHGGKKEKIPEPVSSHKCLHCLSLNSTVCEEVPIDCDGDQCMTASQIYEHGNRKFKSLYKGCAIKVLCNEYSSLTQDPDVRIRVFAACCTGKYCNTGKFYIPKDNRRLNGLKCPTAYCEGTTEDCDKNVKLMNCRGNERCCVEYRGRARDPDGYVNDYSLKACVNQHGCALNYQSLIKVEELERKTLKCCNGCPD